MPYKDKSEYNRKRRADGRKVNIPKPRKFIAIDGEGLETSGKQAYALLSASTGESITCKEGLSTEECLRFILSLKEKGTEIVSFSFSYDVNFIFKDLPEKALLKLYQNEECWYKGKESDYRIGRVKGKTFSITEYSQLDEYYGYTRRLRSAVVWDTFGFFQTTFLRTVKDWKISLDPGEQTVLDEGKAARGGFLWPELEKVREYNLLECRVLVQLMEAVQETLRSLGLYLSRWDGAGSIAAALMKKHGLKQYIRKEYPEELQDAMMRAYFGGRTQAVQFGIFDEPIYHYDLNSAYPSSYLDLPTCHGDWKKTDRYIPGQKYGMYQVRWKMPDDNCINPFPYRMKDGAIAYPHSGRGIYHAALVTIVLERWPKNITIEKGWIFTPESDVKPFAFMKEYMAERLKLKAEGDLRHITMKLGGNSVYGKIVQAVSYKESIPPFQNYFWGGMITCYSHCRLLEAALQDETAVIMFGTDAIFTSRPLNLPIGKELGTWEDCGVIDRFELYQPGLYRMHFHSDKKWHPPIVEPQVKTRGFRQEEIDFDKLAEVWEREKYEGTYAAKVTRFRGYEISIAQNNLEEWRDWKTFSKCVRLSPGAVGVVIDETMGEYYGQPGGANTFRFHYIVFNDEELSAKYDKKNLVIPSPDNTLMLDEWEYLDNPSID